MRVKQIIGLAGVAGWMAMCGTGAKAAGHEAGPDGRSIAQAFAIADANGDGFVNIDEYVGYIVRRVDALSHDDQGRLRPADVPNVSMDRFNDADRDGDGALSLGEVVAERMIVFFDADTDNDGMLTLEELMAQEVLRGEG